MPDEYYEKFKALSETKKLLEIELEQKQISELREKLNEENAASKRKQDKKDSNKRKIIKISERDSIHIVGLRGTLGANLLRLGELISIDDAKSRYFAYLSKNSVLDVSISTINSQVSLLGGNKIQKLILAKYQYIVQNDEYGDDEIAQRLDKECKKINNARAAAKILQSLLLLQSSSIAGNIEIYNYILSQHVNKSFIFSDNYLKKCSEQSIIIKFWGYLFESFFTKYNLFVQWGDTESDICKKNELKMKLDLRMIFEGENTEVLDGLNGEFAKIDSTTKVKYYGDKTKLVLASKCHLNHIITSLKNLPVRNISSLKLPMIQVMGLNCHIYCLSIVDKNVYLLQKIRSISYPRTLHEIKSGSIKTLINGFQLIHDMMENIRHLYNEYNKCTMDTISQIDTDKKAVKSNTKVNEYISPVYADDTEYEDSDVSGDNEIISYEEIGHDSESSSDSEASNPDESNNL